MSQLLRAELLRSAYGALFLALFFLTGCAQPPLLKNQDGTSTRSWQGRMALRIDGSQPQSFSASFALVGQAQAGELILYGPLGSTAAHLIWTPDSATLRSNGTERQFSSLDALATQTTGTNIPIAALFDWLAGLDVVAAGWEADLSQLANHRLTARRFLPEPAAELRLILEP